jgi:integrase
MGDLIAHFRLMEMPDYEEVADQDQKDVNEIDENDRAYSTKDRYDYVLNAWIEPRWGKVELATIIAGEVEKWIRSLKRKPRRGRKGDLPEGEAEKLKPLAPGTKVKIRDLMSVLFNHAIRWTIFATNPIAGPARKAGVRQSGKRQEAPDILELPEMQNILSELSARENALISLDMITGLRRGELAGLKWGDIDFENLLVNVLRSVVDQVTGRCKTEASAKPVPIDEYTAEILLIWYRLTPYREPGDWVFATDSARAGKKRGKQPVWLSKVMQYHIQPLVKRLGIKKRVSWKTFRSTFTSLLTANGENVKVVQELLRQASSKITMDTYAQARMQDKRKAQLRIVKRLRKPQNATSSTVAIDAKAGGKLQRKLA